MTDVGEAGGRHPVLCAGCGCLCDDLPLVDPAAGHAEATVDTDCELGRAWFARRMAGRARGERPTEVEGEAADLPTAAGRAAEVLRAARRPLVTGVERLTLEAQRALVEVADHVRADLRPAGGAESGTGRAVARDGGPFVTLGEIRERADCVVLWRVRPETSHPRLRERFYAGSTRGGRERTTIAVGPDAGSADADVSVAVDREEALRLLWLLRLLADDPGAPEREADPLGSTAADLLERLQAAGAGAWLWDGDAPDGPDPVEASGILRLLTALTEDAPWGARPLRGEGNPVGAEAVATWQAGYAPPLSFRGGVPREVPGTPAGDGGGADAVLLVGGRPSDLSLPDGAACVWLDDGAAAGGTDAGPTGAGDRSATTGGGSGTGAAAVRIPVLPAGAADGDTFLRMDGVGVRSPGVPGADDGPGVRAEAALRALVDALSDAERTEAAS